MAPIYQRARQVDSIGHVQAEKVGELYFTRTHIKKSSNLRLLLFEVDSIGHVRAEKVGELYFTRTHIKKSSNLRLLLFEDVSEIPGYQTATRM